MFCVNCGKEFNLEKLNCSYCQFSIFDAQKLLIEKIQERTTNIQNIDFLKNEAGIHEKKIWKCYFCNKENQPDDFFCACGKSRISSEKFAKDNEQINRNLLSEEELAKINIGRKLPEENGKTWTCSKCGSINPFSQHKCTNCSMLKENNFQKKEEKGFNWGLFFISMIFIIVVIVLGVATSM